MRTGERIWKFSAPSVLKKSSCPFSIPNARLNPSTSSGDCIPRYFWNIENNKSLNSSGFSQNWISRSFIGSSDSRSLKTLSASACWGSRVNHDASLSASDCRLSLVRTSTVSLPYASANSWVLASLDWDVLSKLAHKSANGLPVPIGGSWFGSPTKMIL